MKKPYYHGFCLGKFMPFHKGHQLMIDHAAASCFSVQVLITGTEDEPIPLSIRGDWLRAHYADTNVEIIQLEDHIGKTELDEHGTAIDEDFWQQWINLIDSECDVIDAVFTNDAYGERLAKELGADWVPLDTDRDQFKVSGSAIRYHPWAHWDQLPDVVKPYYQRKIVVIGPESTGKSYMAQHLRGEYNAYLVPEYGRTLSEIKGNDLDATDFRAIYAGQQAMLQAAQDSEQIIIADTETFTTYLFSKMYLSPRIYELEHDLLEAAAKDDFDLYILLKPYKWWDDDGTRVMPEYLDRMSFFLDLKDYLIEFKRNFVIIEDTSYNNEPNWNRRLTDARLACNDMFNEMKSA